MEKYNPFKEGCIGTYNAIHGIMDCDTGISCVDCIHFDGGGRFDPTTGLEIDLDQ